MKHNKPYKACDPSITIHRIRTILNNCGIFLMEKYHKVSTNFYSSRLIISGNNLEELYKGTNGKGLTVLYSLASAYAEFMERIQNNYIFIEDVIYVNFCEKYNIRNNLKDTLAQQGLLLNFKFDPTEKYLSYRDLPNESQDNLKSIAIYNESVKHFIANLDNKQIFVPFFSLKEKEVEYLPIELLLFKTGSNGMCAGNTKREAIIQGLCEILERYAIKKIFQDEPILPTIPLEEFCDTEIYDLIKELKRENQIAIYIKDCSFNFNVPIIGVLIIDYKKNSYAFNVGSATSPSVALQRCFTEIYQGDQYDKMLNKIDFIHNPYKDKDMWNVKNAEMLSFVTRGNGKLPNSILMERDDCVAKRMNWNLNKSDEYDLDFIIREIERNGYQIYIRDVSFLGFPSFYIYVPGMSEVMYPFPEDLMGEKYQIHIPENLMYNLGNKSLEEYDKIINLLENSQTKKITIFPYNVNENNVYDRKYLLALLYYRVSNYEKACKCLSDFVESLDNSVLNVSYFCCARDFIYYRSLNKTIGEIKKQLDIIYPKDLVQEVIADLIDEKKVFDYQDFCTCFNCDICNMKLDCKLVDVLKIQKKIQEAQIHNVIKQDNIAELFLNE